jgi:tetratricopeptide (TPR) repeat protein
VSRPASSETGSADGATLATTDHDGLPAPRPQPGEERAAGTKLGRYTLLEPVGRGGMGIVYAAYDPQLDRRIALKVLRPRRGGVPRPRDRARLEREAQAMARLSHPNVITVHDVAESDGELYLAMEFVDGVTLKRWLEQSPRPWFDVVGVFLAAGEGLSAAHRAGLIHRDFKPDNVLIDAEGRVRVTDFGLARAGDASIISEIEAVEPGASTSVAHRITHAGALLGTPAYMSPEQHARRDLDARSDEFSFCVALYEGLFHTHPFDGETIGELAASVTVGRIREPPRDSAVPAQIRRAILRGLSGRPEARWPSMEPLLAALAFDPRLRRRRLQLAAAGTAIAIVAGGAVYATTRTHTTRSADVCVQAGAGVDAVWNEDRADRIRRAFLGTGRFGAAGSFELLEESLSRYATSWRDESMTACEATRVQGIQSDEMLDLRTACHNRRLEDFDAALAVFEDPDPALVADAAEVASRLIPVAVCADTDRLRSRDPLPDDPVLRPRAEELRRELAELRALHNAGRSATTTERAERLVEDAVALGFPPIRAAAHYRLGLTYEDTDRFTDAEREIGAAADDAAASADDELLADVMLARLNLIGLSQEHYEDALQLEPAVRAIVIRAGDTPEHRTRLEIDNGTMLLGLGRYDEARAAYERARDLIEDTPAMLPRKATVYNNLGAVDFSQGKFAESRELFAQALEYRKKYQGDVHVAVAEGVYNIGNTHLAVGEAEMSVRYFAEALEILAKVSPPGSRAEAGARNSLAVAYASMGRLDEAEAQAKLTERMLSKLMGEHSPARAGPLLLLAELLLLRGEVDEADAMMRDLIADLTDALGPTHPHLGLPMAIRATCTLRRGELTEARNEFLDARKLIAPLGPEHPWMLLSTVGLAEVDRELGDDAAALARVDEIEALCAPGHEDRLEVVRALTVAAQIVGPSDPTRSHTLAARALHLLRTSGGQPAALRPVLESMVKETDD